MKFSLSDWLLIGACFCVGIVAGAWVAALVGAMV